jgi:hypothetical protein
MPRTLCSQVKLRRVTQRREYEPPAPARRGWVNHLRSKGSSHPFPRATAAHLDPGLARRELLHESHKFEGITTLSFDVYYD